MGKGEGGVEKGGAVGMARAPLLGLTRTALQWESGGGPLGHRAKYASPLQSAFADGHGGEMNRYGSCGRSPSAHYREERVAPSWQRAQPRGAGSTLPPPLRYGDLRRSDMLRPYNPPSAGGHGGRMDRYGTCNSPPCPYELEDGGEVEFPYIEPSVEERWNGTYGAEGGSQTRPYGPRPLPPPPQGEGRPTGRHGA